MHALLLLGLPALAFQPAADTWIGQEPVRLHRYHVERQHTLRHSEAWQGFLATDGAGWMARFDEWTETPHRAWGPGIDLGVIEDAADVERALLALLARHPDLVGVPLSQLQLSAASYVASSDTWYVELDQLLPVSSSTSPGDDGWQLPVAGVDSVPVWRSSVEARVRFGKLILLGLDTHPAASSVDTTPTLAGDAAVALAIAEGPHPDADHFTEGAELVVLPVEDDTGLGYRLTWETRTRSGGAGDAEDRNGDPVGIWVSHVDAHTGELLNVYNEVRYLTGEVWAEHDTRTVDGDMSESPLVNLEVETEEASTYTDSDGIFSVSGSTATAGLTGRYISVRNQDGASAEATWTGSEYVLTTSDGTQAELDSYVFLEQVRDWGNEYASGVSILTNRLRSNVNIESACNAYYDGNVNFYQAGSGCNNTGRIADVNHHEWGHGFHYYNLEAGSWDGAMSEGIGDTVAFLHSGDHIIAPYFMTGGSGIREVSSDAVYPDDWTGEVHADGLIFAGAVWDLWEVLEEDHDEGEAYDIVSQLFVDALKAGPETDESYDEFVAADDDDGDLGNGTPNQCAILEAFSLHGLGPGGDAALLSVTHEPLANQPADAAEYALSADLLNLAPDCVDFEVDTATVSWSTDGGQTWDTAELDLGEDTVEGAIPAVGANTIVDYYVTVSGTDGESVTAPTGATINPFTFWVGELTELYCEGFEDDEGDYTHELLDGDDELGADDWMWGRPRGSGGDPDFAAEGSYVWGNDLGGGNYNGEYQNSKHNRLTSPDIDVAGHERLVLQYKRWLNVEDGYYDQARILSNGATVWSNHGTDSDVGDEHHADEQWALHTVELPVPEEGTVALSWEIESDRGLTMGGWTIDEVCVYGVGEAQDVDDTTDDNDDDQGGPDGNLDGSDDLSVSGCGGCSTAAPSAGGAPAAALLVGLAALGLRRRED